MWDKDVSIKFRALGCSQELIGQIIGEISEQRQLMDQVGYARGLDAGYEMGYKKGFEEAAELADGMKAGGAVRIAGLERRIQALEEA